MESTQLSDWVENTDGLLEILGFDSLNEVATLLTNVFGREIEVREIYDMRGCLQAIEVLIDESADSTMVVRNEFPLRLTDLARGAAEVMNRAGTLTEACDIRYIPIDAGELPHKELGARLVSAHREMLIDAERRRSVLGEPTQMPRKVRRERFVLRPEHFRVIHKATPGEESRAGESPARDSVSDRIKPHAER